MTLYKFIRDHPPGSIDLWDKYLLDSSVGAAFSLWRAAFLAETLRGDVEIHASQEAFLERLITDNTITFGDDKINRHWTVG